jgi:DNA primase
MSVEVAKQRILQRVPLAALIGETVALTTRSGRQVGLCPFHGEKSPSFTIFDDHYFCFGCRARGDAITFVREMQGLSFLESLRYLAEKFGIDVPELEHPTHDRQARLTEANLYKICAESLNFFRERLNASNGAFALQYLESRGFTREFIDKHQFGLSPQEPQFLVNHLLRKGFAIKDMITASVANSSQYDNKAYDFFNQRLMIPIFDMHGRAIAFGGRSFGDEQPKYKNSRETPLFDKSQVLYGLHLAKEPIRRDRRAIVCEGYMDVLQLWQAGMPQAVACLGTALTIHHLRRLAALTPRVYLIFDGDRAGRAATLRTVSLALEVPQAEFKVVVLPEEHDPDTFVKEYGIAGMEQQLETAQNLLEFAIQARLMETHDLGVPDLINKEFVPWLQSVEDPVRRQYLLVRIAELTGVPAADLEVRVKPEAAKRVAPSRVEAPAPPPPRPKVLELKGAELEFMGHLFHSRPGEIDLDGMEQMLKTQLELDELWLDFALELTKALRRSLVPSELNKSHWTTLVFPEALALIERLEQDAPLYVTAARQQQLEKLAKEVRRKALKESLARLKQNLMRGTAEEQREILAAVARITKELNAAGLEGRSANT